MKALLLFVIYALVFGSPVTFLPSYLNLTNIAVLISVVLCFSFRVKLAIRTISIFMAPLFLYLFYTLITFSFEDISFTIQNLRLIGIAFSSYIVAYLLTRNFFYTVEDLFKLISIIIIISCIVSIASIQYNEIQKTINLIIKPNMNEGVLDYINNFRFNGITGLSGSELSIVYSLFFIYVSSKLGRSISGNFFYYLLSLIVIVGIIIVGRTGFVSAAIFLFAGCLYYKKYRYISLGMVLMIFLVPFSFVVYEYRELFPVEFRFILLWAFEPIYKGVFLAELSGSNDILSKMWYLPNDSYSALFGVGSWSELIYPPNGYYKPDPGYMRLMYQHGIIVQFLGLTWLFLTTYFISDRNNRFIYSILVFSLLLLNFKEAYLYRDPLFSIISLVFFLSMTKYSNERLQDHEK